MCYPAVSADGKRYTFTVRPSFRFNTGERLTARHFAHAINRTLLLHGPGEQYVGEVVGAPAVSNGAAKTASGVQARGSRLVVHLTPPVPDFPLRMVYPSFCAVRANLPSDPEGPVRASLSRAVLHLEVGPWPRAGADAEPFLRRQAAAPRGAVRLHVPARPRDDQAAHRGRPARDRRYSSNCTCGSRGEVRDRQVPVLRSPDAVHHDGRAEQESEALSERAAAKGRRLRSRSQGDRQTRRASTR